MEELNAAEQNAGELNKQDDPLELQDDGFALQDEDFALQDEELATPERDFGTPERDQPRILIGRSSRCHVIIESPLVSRRHCALVPTKEGYLLQDLGSRNGTWIAGERRQSAVLRAGDQFRIADVGLRLGIGGKVGISHNGTESSRLVEGDS